MREVVEADWPRWVALVVLHQVWYVHIVRLGEDFGCELVLFVVSALRQLLVVICEASKGEEFVDELLSGIIVGHHDSTLV